MGKTVKITVKLFRAELEYPDGAKETFETEDLKNAESELRGYVRATSTMVLSRETISRKYEIALSDVITHGTPYEKPAEE